MLSKKIIGLIIGIIVIIIGIYLLISSIGFVPTVIDETIGSGTSKSYKIYSDNHGFHTMKIIGEKFDLELTSPDTGLQIPKTSHSEEVKLEWVHLQDGYSLIDIQNTGSSDLQILATFEVTAEPISFLLNSVVIIVGMVIVGFTLNFRNTKELPES